MALPKISHVHVIAPHRDHCVTCAVLTAAARGLPVATAAHAWRLANAPQGPDAPRQRAALRAAARAAIAACATRSADSDAEREARRARVRACRAVWSLLWLLEQPPEREEVGLWAPAMETERVWWM